MALYSCPNCKKDTFTWIEDEEISESTIWGCYECRYEAFEDESYGRICNKCETKTKSELRLKDDKKEYWWCATCNTIKIIKNCT